jgi:hypothetical protein
MKIKFTIIFPLIILLYTNAFTQEINLDKTKSWYVPDYVKTQFAGNIGLISVGAGYQLFNKVLYTELLYGFVPKRVSKAENIHLITIKNTFPIYRKEIGKNLTITPIAGFAATLDIGTTTFTTLPSKFPDGYYVPTAFHATLFGGIMVHKDFTKPKIFKGMDFYVEIGTVESYLWYAITSSVVDFSTIFSADVGVNFYF